MATLSGDHRSSRRSRRGVTALSMLSTLVLITLSVVTLGPDAANAEPDIGTIPGTCPAGTPSPYPWRHDYCVRSSEYATVSVDTGGVRDGTQFNLTLNLIAPQCSAGAPVYPCVESVSWDWASAGGVAGRLVIPDGTYFTTLQGGSTHYYQPFIVRSRGCVFGSPRPSSAMTCPVEFSHIPGLGGLPASWLILMPAVRVDLSSAPLDTITVVTEAVTRLLVDPVEEPPPSVDFSVVRFQPGEYQFDSTVFGGTPPYRYAWTYGNGETGTAALGGTVYTNPGDFPVTLTVTDANDKTATVTKQVLVLPPELQVTVDYADESLPLVVDSPTQIVVKVRADGDGVGSLRGLRFDGDPLQPIPTTAVEITGGPEPPITAPFELQPGEERSFTFVAVARQPVRAALRSTVVGVDAIGLPVTDQGELSELLSPIEVTLVPASANVVRGVAEGDNVRTYTDELGTVHTVYGVAVTVTNVSDVTLENLHVEGLPTVGGIEELDPGDLPVANSAPAADDASVGLDVPEQPDPMIGVLEPGASSEPLMFWFEALQQGTSAIEALVLGNVVGGNNVAGLGTTKVKVLEKVLVELRVKVRQDPNQPPALAGRPVQLIAELQNFSDEQVGVVPEVFYGDSDLAGWISNASNGFLHPRDETTTPWALQGILLEPGETKLLKATVATLPTPEPSRATITYHLSAFEREVDDGGGETWTDISEFAAVANDPAAGWTHPVHQQLVPNDPEPFPAATSCGEVWGEEFADWTWCGMVHGVENFVTGILQLPSMLIAADEWMQRQRLYQLRLLGLSFLALAQDPAAKAELEAEAKKVLSTMHWAFADPDGLLSNVAGVLANYIDSMADAYASGDPQFFFKVGEAVGENADLVLEGPVKIGLKVATTWTLKNMVRPIAGSAVPKAINRYLDAKFTDAALRIEQGAKIADVAEPGMDARQYMKRLGYGDEAVEAMFDACQHVICVFKTRDELADFLISNDLAWPKWEQFKQKTVKALDRWFGVPIESPLKGTAAVIEPPFSERLAGMPDPKTLDGPALTAFKTELDQIVDEWIATLDPAGIEDVSKLRGLAATRAVEYLDFKHNIQPNLGALREHGYEVLFQPSTQEGLDHVDTERIRVAFDMVEYDIGGGRKAWQIQTGGVQPGTAHLKRPLASDPDAVFFLDPDSGAIASPEQRLTVMQQIFRDPRLGTNHGETGSLVDPTGANVEAWMPDPDDLVVTVGPGRSAKFARVVKVGDGFLPTTSRNWMLLDGTLIGHYMVKLDWSLPASIVNGFDTWMRALVIDGWIQRLTRLIDGAYDNASAPPGQAPQGVAGFNRDGSVIAVSAAGDLQRWTPTGAGAPPERFTEVSALGSWQPITYADAVGADGVLDPAPMTLLARFAKAGESRLDVMLPDELGVAIDGGWFQPGDQVVLDPGGPREEIVTVTALGSLVLAAPLAFDHPLGELVALVPEQVPDPVPTTTTTTPPPITTITTTPTTPTVAPTTTLRPGGTLPRTGGDAEPLVAIAVGLTVVGFVLLSVRRRQRA